MSLLAAMLDPVFLSRLQFFWVVSWHILLPAFTVGLALYIAVLETLWFRRRDEVYLRLSTFWTRMFAISFGMGVVSGVVMPFQFGTNWSRFSQLTANVIGPLLAYEGLMAFFLEAGFLGVLLFGRKLVPPWMHLFSAYLVALGTVFSSFWILAVNSWMQTPAGHEIVDGVFYAADWMQVIFTPSFPYRLAHVVTAFMITTGFVVVGTAATYLLRQRFVVESRRMLSMTLWLLTALVPLQILLGDLHGLNTLEHQPVKVAAMEGNWDTPRAAPFVLFGLPDEREERNRAEIAIPYASSLILRHDPEGEVPTLKQWPASERPPVAIVFWSFRIMLACGFFFLAVVLWGNWLKWRGRLYDQPLFLRVCQAAIPLGFVAVIAGWVTTECGRQPWLVYGLLRTADGVSPALQGGDVLTSLLIYVVVYSFVFPAGLYFMLKIARGGPKDIEDPHALVEGRQRQLPPRAAGKARATP
jgi:cytochrome bd ubiquinol oxidase subunit I